MSCGELFGLFGEERCLVEFRRIGRCLFYLPFKTEVTKQDQGSHVESHILNSTLSKGKLSNLARMAEVDSRSEGTPETPFPRHET